MQRNDAQPRKQSKNRFQLHRKPAEFTVQISIFPNCRTREPNYQQQHQLHLKGLSSTGVAAEPVFS